MDPIPFKVWRVAQLRDGLPIRRSEEVPPEDELAIRPAFLDVSQLKRDSTDAQTMKIRSTTILTVRSADRVAIGGDGQVSLNDSIMKADAIKIRHLAEGNVLCGFAGASADAFALLERFETKLKDFPANLPRAATELAKLWRTDRALRRLEALMIVVDAKHTLLVGGTGDVIQPSDGILAIGSGGNYAVAAARGLASHTNLSAAAIVREALLIAASIDVYTNDNIVVEELECLN